MDEAEWSANCRLELFNKLGRLLYEGVYDNFVSLAAGEDVLLVWRAKRHTLVRVCGLLFYVFECLLCCTRRLEVFDTTARATSGRILKLSIG